MRILSIGAGLGRGGTERALETFSIAYQRFGHEVAVLAWQAGGQRQATLEDHGIEVFLGAADHFGRAIAAADAFAPDLIHIHRVGVACAAETEILRRLRRSNRRVLETNVFGRVDRSEGREHIDVHMHLSPWCLWRWRRWLGPTSPAPVGVVVPNPVDPSRFVRASRDRCEAFRARIGVPGSAFLCGRVAQPNAVKWHRSTLTAFADLARVDPDAHLVVVGLPRSFRLSLRLLPVAVQRRVIELPLMDSDAELADLYSSLDCFLHSARCGESFGYVLAEAMLCGCPVVTASTPHVDNSQVEVVGHLTGGVVAGSARALSDALLHLWSDAELRERLKPGLPAHVTSRFAVERVASLALTIGTLALGSRDREALRRGVAELPGRVDRVDDEEIATLLGGTLGAPRRRDLVEMRIRHHHAVQRMIDARLTWRLVWWARKSRYRPAIAPVDPVSQSPPRVISVAERSSAVTVSAIMPTYNTGRYVAQAIESVLAQTTADWELIVVDDASTDDTLAVVSRYTDPRISVLRLPRNCGRSIARNTALKYARGRYIAICDSDDISVPTRFARQAAFLDSHPGIAVVSGQLAHFSEHGAPRVRMWFPEAAGEIRDRFSRGRMGVAHGASMIRAECFSEHGAYCSDLRSAEDLEFFRRVSAHAQFHSLPEVLVAYRHDLPDPFRSWMASARHHRYAVYRSGGAAAQGRRIVSFEEFSRHWKNVFLNHSVDLLRFIAWRIRSHSPQEVER